MIDLTMIIKLQWNFVKFAVESCQVPVEGSRMNPSTGPPVLKTSIVALPYRA